MRALAALAVVGMAAATRHAWGVAAMGVGGVEGVAGTWEEAGDGERGAPAGVATPAWGRAVDGVLEGVWGLEAAGATAWERAAAVERGGWALVAGWAWGRAAAVAKEGVGVKVVASVAALARGAEGGWALVVGWAWGRAAAVAKEGVGVRGAALAEVSGRVAAAAP